jgi:transcriptional regulator with XRE-family HTH domain
MQQQPLSLGDVIKKARETDGISIRELARRSGISAGQISRIESGETEQPATETLAAIARAFGGSPAPLLRLAGHKGDAVEQEIGRIEDSLGDMSDIAGDIGDRIIELESSGGSEDEVAALLFHASRLSRPEYWLGNMGLDDSADAVAEIMKAWPAITPERRKLILAFVADQEVLSALDRLPSSRGRYSISIELEELSPEEGS